MTEARPKNEVNANGWQIIYQIWREDLAEAIVFIRQNQSDDGNRPTKVGAEQFTK